MTDLAAAIYNCFESQNVSDSNLEPANIVDTIDNVASALHGIKRALLDPQATYSKDAGGGTVNCLIEAIMGVTKGLFAIASSIESVAEVLEDK